MCSRGCPGDLPSCVFFGNADRNFLRDYEARLVTDTGAINISNTIGTTAVNLSISRLLQVFGFISPYFEVSALTRTRK